MDKNVSHGCNILLLGGDKEALSRVAGPCRGCGRVYRQWHRGRAEARWRAPTSPAGRAAAAARGLALPGRQLAEAAGEPRSAGLTAAALPHVGHKAGAAGGQPRLASPPPSPRGEPASLNWDTTHSGLQRTAPS